MDTVGGYRLVRLLGSGARAQVWLAHGGAGHDEPVTVAVKRFRPAVSLGSIDREIEALGRASSRHLLRLIDLATGEDARPCLILQRLGAAGTPSLGRLLSEREELGAGEAVTILAPLAQAVAELHRVGVAHAALRPSAVLFDELGAPVIAGFGSAQLIGDFPDPPDGSSLTPQQLSAQPMIAADLAQFVALARGVLERVAEAHELLGDLRELVQAMHASPAGFESSFLESLFSLAEAEPVALGTVPPPASGQTRTAEAFRIRDVAGEPQPAPAASSPGWLAAFHLPERLERFVLSHVENSPLVTLRAWLAAHLRNVRKRVWVFAAVSMVSLLSVLVVASLRDVAPPDAAPSETALSNDTSSASASLTSPVPNPSPEATTDPAISGSDPLAAAHALLEQRAQCLAVHSILCLDTVDQASSAAMDADSHWIRNAQEGGALPVEALLEDATVSLVEQLGDSALLSVQLPGAGETAPASLLLVRGEAGWRIRDLVIG